MTEQTSQPQAKNSTGRTVLYAFLGFFAVFAAVDAFFVYTAVTTNTGVVTENSYERGLHYNDLLDEARKRKDEQQPATNE